jgi:hypothetical protein
MKTNDKNIRKITRAGKTSMSVTLPMDMVRELNWKEKQKLVAKRIPGGISFRDWREK